MKAVVPVVCSLLVIPLFACAAVGFVLAVAFAGHTLMGDAEGGISAQAVAGVSLAGILLVISIRALRLFLGRHSLRPRVIGEARPDVRHYDLTGTLWGSRVQRSADHRPLIHS